MAGERFGAGPGRAPRNERLCMQIDVKPENFPANVARVRAEIAAACAAAGRPPESVRLVAASKYGDAAAVRALYACGLREFGENRAEAAAEKAAALADLPDLRWHFIGHLQRNKAKKVLPACALLHSVDSPALLETLEKLLAPAGRTLDVLLEINLGGEESKSGAAPEQALSLARAAAACPCLRPRGLMGMAPLGTDNDAARPFFRQLRELRDALQQTLGMPLPELSMGMSHDFAAAIAEGATMVRIGSALFA